MVANTCISTTNNNILNRMHNNTVTKVKQQIELVQVNWDTKVELIKVAQNKLNSNDYIELTNFLRAEYKIDVSQDDIVKYLDPIIHMEKKKLIHKLYGTDNR